MGPNEGWHCNSISARKKECSVYTVCYAFCVSFPDALFYLILFAVFTWRMRLVLPLMAR